jgi:hypothetical protein
VATSALVWEIALPDEYPRYNVHLGMPDGREPKTIDPNGYGLVTRSLAPGWMTPLASSIIESQHMPTAWLLWSPALYLYLAVAGAAITAARRRSWKLMLVLLPLGLHSIVLMFILPCQHFRFQYPAYLVGSLLGIVFLLWPVVDALEALSGRKAASVDTSRPGC